MKKLEWYAFDQACFDGTGVGRLEYINVIRERYIESMKKLIKKNATYEEIKDDLRGWLIHDFWGKAEYEVIVSNWSGYDFEEKIDVWYQLEPNLDRITEYMIRELAPRKCEGILKGRKKCINYGERKEMKQTSNL